MYMIIATSSQYYILLKIKINYVYNLFDFLDNISIRY
jgi:hypothetical protein